MRRDPISRLVGYPMSVDAKYEVTATANGGHRDGKTALADATMFLDLVIPKQLEARWRWRKSREAFQARQLVEATHEICPYSNAIKVSVDVKTTTRS
jgi:organic hydroperoxide reductase OsmC/OhrA